MGLRQTAASRFSGSPAAPDLFAASPSMKARSTRSAWHAIEQIRSDTLYVATTGGMGPDTIAALNHLFAELFRPNPILSSSSARIMMGPGIGMQSASLH